MGATESDEKKNRKGSTATGYPSPIEQNVLSIIGQTCVRGILETIDTGNTEASRYAKILVRPVTLAITNKNYLLHKISLTNSTYISLSPST